MAGIDWNTHFPSEVGNEHIDAGQQSIPIDLPTPQGSALRFRAKVTGTINAVDLYADNGASAPLLDARYVNLPKPMLCEVVPAGSEAMEAFITTYNPTAITGSGVVNENLTTPVTVSRILTNGDGLFVTSPALNGFFDVQFDTAAFPLDRHVLGITVLVSTTATYGLGRGDPGVPPLSSNVLWDKEIPALAPVATPTEVTNGETKVDQNETVWTHWTAQDIRDFRSGGSRFWRVRCRAAPGGGWRISEVKMKVLWTPERRVAVGIGTPTTSFAWTRFDLATPPATGNPSLTLNADYSLLVRRIWPYNVDSVNTSVLPWRHLRGFPQDAHWEARPIQTTGKLVLSILNLGDVMEGIACARFVTGGAITATAQPYVLQRGARVWGAQTASQTITITGAASAITYGQAYVTAGWDPANGRPEGTLRCKVIRESDQVTVFSLTETTAAAVERLPVSAPSNDIDDQNTRYKTIQFRFPESLVLTPGVYRIFVDSPGTTQAKAWRVGALIADDVDSPDQTFSVAGIAGGSNAATGTWISGSSTSRDLTSLANNISSDLMATLAAVPAAVTGLAASVGTVESHHAEVCSRTEECKGCGNQDSPFVTLTWSPSASGNPDVAGYDIDRMDSVIADWERIAFATGRLTNTYPDHEPRIGVASSYRVRAVLTSGVTGDWSASVSATPPGGQAALVFSSSAATGMGAAYPEVWDGREVTRAFNFDEFRDVTLQTIYARNRPIATRPIERQGDSFSRTLLLNAGCTVALPTMQIFRPLRDLAWAPIPYVCVRDGEGNRWYASLQVPSGNNVRPGERWLVEVGITEVQDSSAVYDTADPQVTEPIPVESIA